VDNDSNLADGIVDGGREQQRLPKYIRVSNDHSIFSHRKWYTWGVSPCPVRQR
jgi:hypothetical protein